VQHHDTNSDLKKTWLGSVKLQQNWLKCRTIFAQLFAMTRLGNTKMARRISYPQAVPVAQPRALKRANGAIE
jgi:hypothetical protein